jgi:hypothetical protein
VPPESAAGAPSWLEDLEAAGRAAASGISSNARTAVDQALKTSATQAQVCHEHLCDNVTIAPINAQEWHKFFKTLYLTTWSDLIPQASIFVTNKEKNKASKRDAMLRRLITIKDTALDALTAVDAFVQKPNRSNRKTAITSVESVCDALAAWFR